MVTSTLKSFTDNLNQRLKNPFLGTFVVVWLIRNWKFIYSLIYFDPSLSLEDRIAEIKACFTDYGIHEILITIGLTFLIIIVTYTLLNLSRLIINFFEKVITPKVYQLSDKSSVVLKVTYEELLTSMELLETKVQSEREYRLQIQSENENLESRLKELLFGNTESSSDVKKSTFSRKVKVLSNKLESQRKKELFEETAADILNNISIDQDLIHISEFTTLGLIKRKHSYSNGTAVYELTEDGKELHEYFILEAP